MGTYHPREFRALTFHDALKQFREGTDTPRDYLERCLDAIAARDTTVKAYVAMNVEASRAAADAATRRWRDARPLSSIDGMPVSIKDLLETKDMPTQMGCEAYAGNFPKRDNAGVWALREAGAVVLGKTVTAELGGSQPGPTTNPFDPRRTPGGSSSGSAAAVAAGMVPAAIGSQVGGSIIRPAGFCGNVALKPTQGGLNRGERQATSMSTHGPHAGSIQDMWQVAIEIARRAGGDRGCLGLFGPDTTPVAIKPQRLIVLETQGWDRIEASTKTVFDELVGRIENSGVEILCRSSDRLVEALEIAIENAQEIASHITGWENRWNTRNLVNQCPSGVSQRAKSILEHAETMTPDDYRALLVDRHAAQIAHAALGHLGDAAITLACPGPAPLWEGDTPGEALASRPTGDAVFNYPSSMLFAPVVTVPMMAEGGLPIGLQVMGQQHTDARVTAHARWLLENVEPVVC